MKIQIKRYLVILFMGLQISGVALSAPQNPSFSNGLLTIDLSNPNNDPNFDASSIVQKIASNPNLIGSGTVTNISLNLGSNTGAANQLSTILNNVLEVNGTTGETSVGTFTVAVNSTAPLSSSTTATLLNNVPAALVGNGEAGTYNIITSSNNGVTGGFQYSINPGNPPTQSTLSATAAATNLPPELAPTATRSMTDTTQQEATAILQKTVTRQPSIDLGIPVPTGGLLNPSPSTNSSSSTILQTTGKPLTNQ